MKKLKAIDVYLVLSSWCGNYQKLTIKTREDMTMQMELKSSVSEEESLTDPA